VIHTPFSQQTGTPIQPRFAREAEGVVEVFEPYVEALADLDGFERIWLLFLLDRSRPWRPRVIPYLDRAERGLFATRAPARPCPIGLSVVELLSVTGSRLTVRGVDILDRTPLVDLKPYVPRFDSFPDSRAGWLDARGIDPSAADSRFSNKD
jgi:tRNA-Thr(GGU) m(6)t(6)A37 methyltransferase TsaA